MRHRVRSRFSCWMRSFLFIGLLLAIAMPAYAISRRHDVPESDYIQLGESFPYVGFFINEFSGASGVLISPQWVLTASHNLMFITQDNFEMEFNGQIYQVDYSRRHFAELPAPFSASFGLDVALLHLTEPVTDVIPVELYTGDAELGQEVVIAGFGIPGHGGVYS